MTPPQLATDTPVLNVSHPGEIGVFPVLWNEFYRAVFASLIAGSARDWIATYHWW